MVAWTGTAFTSLAAAAAAPSAGGRLPLCCARAAAPAAIAITTIIATLDHRLIACGFMLCSNEVRLKADTTYGATSLRRGEVALEARLDPLFDLRLILRIDRLRPTARRFVRHAVLVGELVQPRILSRQPVRHVSFRLVGVDHVGVERL